MSTMTMTFCLNVVSIGTIQAGFLEILTWTTWSMASQAPNLDAELFCVLSLKFQPHVQLSTDIANE